MSAISMEKRPMSGVKGHYQQKVPGSDNIKKSSRKAMVVNRGSMKAGNNFAAAIKQSQDNEKFQGAIKAP